MTEKSYLCKFISENPDNWEERLNKEYNIKVKTESPYAIFNYSPGCNFFLPIVQEARGIIINIETLDVVCWPFRKFGNYVESYADPIDWSSARVLEKIDGSIVKLWYDAKNGKWQFSTNANIRAENANIDDCIGLCFGTVIKRADNYCDIPFDILNPDYTYIFELVSPETQVIVKYPCSSLFHLGTRSNLTGEEFDINIGIKKPSSYPITSLEECIKAALILNGSEQSEISAEGFVVVDGSWNRVKVKSPDYIMKHRFHQVRNVPKYDCIAMLINGDSTVCTLCENNPNLIPLFKYYDYKLSELKYQASQMALLARNLYAEYDGDRKALAAIISKHRLSIIGFRAITCEENGENLLLSLTVDKLARLIPDYEPDELYSVFNITKNG